MANQLSRYRNSFVIKAPQISAHPSLRSIERSAMRFVVLGSLMGFGIAAGGLAFFGIGWLMALAIWLAGGPIGAILALVSALPRPAARPSVSVAPAGIPSRAA
jgi:hypothetical protein